jgi:hypothetical protein
MTSRIECVHLDANLLKSTQLKTAASSRTHGKAKGEREPKEKKNPGEPKERKATRGKERDMEKSQT